MPSLRPRKNGTGDGLHRTRGVIAPGRPDRVCVDEARTLIAEPGPFQA